MQLLTKQKFQPLSGTELFFLPPKADDCQLGRAGGRVNGILTPSGTPPRPKEWREVAQIWLQELSGDCYLQPETLVLEEQMSLLTSEPVRFQKAVHESICSQTQSGTR